jgi:hypothetical protein
MGAGTLIGARLLQYSGALVLFGTSVFYLYGFRRVATSEAPAEQCPNVDRDGSFKLLNMIQKVLYFLGLYLNIDSPSRTVTAVLAAESLDAQGQLVFAQLMRHLPLTTFRRCVARYAGVKRWKRSGWFRGSSPGMGSISIRPCQPVDDHPGDGESTPSGASLEHRDGNCGPGLIRSGKGVGFHRQKS